MNKQRALELDTGFTLEEWREHSRKGERCGILGCFSKPVKRCAHCGNHYCDEHKFVIDTIAHKRR